MEKLLKYFLSLICLFLLLACDRVPLAYRLQYTFTSEERDSLENRISKEVRRMYEGSVTRQFKLDTLIALNNEKEEYFRMKSFKFSRTGNFSEGISLIDKAVQLDPLNALYFTSWQMLFTYRDYERALEDLSYYDDIADGVNYVSGENIHYLKGLANKQLGRYDEAVKEFDMCILTERNGPSEEVYLYRGIANLRHECLDNALFDFRSAIDIDEKCTMAYVYMGEAYIKMDSCQLALPYLWQAEDLLCRGVKKTNPYFEVFDEVYLDQVYDLIDRCEPFEL